MRLCRILTAIAVLLLVACKSTTPPPTPMANQPPPVQYEQGPQAPSVGPRTFTPGVPVPPIQHNPFTITTNDPAVTVPVQQPVSITTTNQVSMVVPSLISTTNMVNGALNVKAIPFQAVGNNIADDYAAIQGAINMAGNGGSIYLPQGIYFCSQPLVMQRNQRIVGEGARALQSTTTTIRFAGSGIRLVEAIDEFDFPCIENICLLGSGTGTGIDAQHVHEVYFKRCRVLNFNYGIHFEQSWDIVMEDVQASDNATAGLFLDTLVTDLAALECQISNNLGYGVLLDTAAPRDVQLIRFFGGSLQYNRYGNWLNGGISLLFDNVHFEGNGARDLLLGSATNRVYAIDMRVNHYDWSDNQYTNAVNTWGDIPGYYQIVCSNVFHLVNNDEHSNVAGTHKRAGVYVSELCEDISLGGISSYVAPYAISKIRLNVTNPGQNLIPNGLLSHQIGSQNYPWYWISDDTNSPVASYQTVSNILGSTYTFQLTNNTHIYPDVTNYPLQLGNTYTWTTLLRATNGQRVMLEARNRLAGSITDTANIITNDNTYQWIVSRYVVDDTNKLDAVFYYRQLDPGFASIEFGEASLVAGNGVGGASTWDFRGVVGYIPRWSTNVPALASTSLLYDTGSKVGVNTNNPAFTLHVYATSDSDGVGIDGSNPELQLRRTNGVAQAIIGASTTAGTFFSNASSGALALRSEVNEINLGGTGGNSSWIQMDNSSTAHDTRLLLWDVDKGTLSRVSVGTNDSAGAGYKILKVPN